MSTRTVVLPSLAVLLLAGCGGSSSSSSSSSGSTSKATTAKAGTVTMKDIQFAPQKTTVKVGETVTWTNEESVQHNVEATSGATFASKLLGQGQSFSYTPTKAGSISFVCTIHPGMQGTLDVTG